MRELNKKSIPIYFLIIVFIFSKIFIYNSSNASTFSNIINPLFWMFTAIIAYFCSISQIERRKRVKYDIVQSIIIILIIYAMIYFSLGLLTGYERSPYSHQFNLVIQNLWIFWIYIIFQEYIRAVLLKMSPSKIAYQIFITLLFVFVEISFSSLTASIKSNADFFKYISETIIPLVVTNGLFTYLTITAGKTPAIIYRSVMILMTLLLPIYPNLNWLIASMIEIVLVIIISLYVNYTDIKYSREFTKRQVKKEKVSSYLPFIILLIILVCFITGAFKYRPIAVLSNSMYSTFSRGDAVVVEKVTEKYLQKLKKGTIIYYGKENKMIMHRVISISKDDNGKTQIITKGDNNNAEDPWIVEEKDIQGIVRFMIPYIGYPSVLVNELLK